MSDRGHDDLDGLDEALLGDFVSTLRAATPSAAELAPARRALVGAPRRGTPWLKILLALAALGVSAEATAPLARTHDAAPPASHGTVVVSREESDAGPVASVASSTTEEAARIEDLAVRPEGLPVRPEGLPVRPEGLPVRPEGLPVRPEGLPVRPEGLPVRPEGLPVRPEGLPVRPEALSFGGVPQASESRVVPVSSASSAAKSDEATLEPEGEPSALYASAMRSVTADRCEEAAPLLSRLVEGETSDARERTEQAELALARCLFTLGYVTTAASVADGIATRADHRGRLAALELLARLGERLPDPRIVVATLGHYRAEELSHAEPHQLGTLRYLLGRARYDEGELEEAAALFASVPPGHRFHVPARYLEGMSHVRSRHARPAIAAFEAVLAASQGSAGEGSGERDRYRDLARLALARVRYTAARPGQGELDARRVALLEDALETWQEIPFGGEAGLEAFFEESWALYLLDESPRALGHIHGLLAPQLRERPHPEALVLRATIYFEHCRFDAARRTVDDFHARFDPLLAALERVERSVAETEAGYALLEAVRSERSVLPGDVGGGEVAEVVRAALDDRELARLVVSVRAIDAESDRLAHARPEIREGSLGMRIAQELALARSFSVDLGGRLVRDRLARVSGSLRDHANEIDTVALEIDTVTRRALEDGTALTREPERAAPIVAVQGDQVWPFDGEYWEDELPYYRELVTDLCVR